MPPPPLVDPSVHRVVDLVDSGQITAEQGIDLLRARRRAAPGPDDFLGPRPSLREALAPLAGIGLALGLTVLAIVADTLVAGRTHFHPGDVLLVATLGLVAILALLAGFLPEGGGTACGTAALALLGLFVLIHPDPRPWMAAGPTLALAALLALTMRPATRVVAAVPPLWSLLVVLMDAFVGSDLQTVLTLVVAGLYVLALSLALPFGSGWRRVPFAAQAATFVLLVGGAVFVLDRIPRLDNLLLSLLGLATYAIVLWVAWTDRRVRAFDLPTLRFGLAARARRNG